MACYFSFVYGDCIKEFYGYLFYYKFPLKSFSAESEYFDDNSEGGVTIIYSDLKDCSSYKIFSYFSFVTSSTCGVFISEFYGY